MTTSIDARIKAQEDKLKHLKSQRQKIEARKRASAAKITRQQDTRKKVLAGAMVLQMMDGDESTRQRFIQRLEAFLVRNDDRALFGISPKSPNPTKES